MIRVVHLFDVKPTVSETAFIEWLDTQLDLAARRFGCVSRKTWALLDGFTGSYDNAKPVRDRPRYVNEAQWNDMDGPNKFRQWLTQTPDGKEFHDRWFSSISNHTVLRYVEGWTKQEMEG
jgi:hypothetical protein